MSGQAEVVVAIDCAPATAPLAAQRALGWLRGHGYVTIDPLDASPDGATGGLPGPRLALAVMAAVRTQATLERLRRDPASRVEVVVGRQVHHAGANGLELACPSCGRSVEPGDDWYDEAGAWNDGDDGASWPCPACAAPQRLAEWDGPCPWGFGALAVRFCGWPPLDAGFVAALARELGSRVRVVHQSLAGLPPPPGGVRRRP